MIALLTLIIILIGERSTFKVIDFYAIDRAINRQEQVLSFVFNRPVEKNNLDKNIEITPELP
ncbi:MAG: hypothetical protein ACRC2V_22170, partial [Xenococcaceae cyanobacterium]